ncbi:MAG: sulfate ABC transporter ATP-binding protein [Planctomycetes bacterium]|nr:sulfate ABC transporter ATP-binding protein [Planctomycetota bacterium]
MRIDIRSISKRFGSFTALDRVDLSIASGELVALLGPSGSGKTTLLRIIAGLEQADGGSLAFGDSDVTAADPRARGVGFVFQHYALFRHMTVAENVAFGLTVKPRDQRPSRADIRARALELLRLVQLDGFAHRFPHQLSGGQRQRVALARALAVEPRVLLLDEPFGALDAKVRVELRRWLRRLHDETGITSVFVTHDQEEALEVSDRVAVLNHGRLEQVGTPEQVYRHPASAFVHQFLGQVNVFHERGQDQAGADPARVALVRPHDVLVARAADPLCQIPAVVEAIAIAGPQVRLSVLPAGAKAAIEAHLTHDQYDQLALSRGDAVFIGYSRAKSYQASDLPTTVDYQI